MICRKCNWIVHLASKQEELCFPWGPVFWGSIDPRYKALKADVILQGEIECGTRNSLLNGDDDCSSIVLNQQCEMVSSLTRTCAKNFWSLISVINLTIFWAPYWNEKYVKEVQIWSLIIQNDESSLKRNFFKGNFYGKCLTRAMN
jgi:hypothetical protein